VSIQAPVADLGRELRELKASTYILINAGRTGSTACATLLWLEKGPMPACKLCGVMRAASSLDLPEQRARAVAAVVTFQ
jgi:hypothetical protein